MLEKQEAAKERNNGYIDIDDLLDDPDLHRIHEERIAQMQKEAEKRAEMKQKGHGTYEQIEEGKFLEVVTKTELVVVHFFHKEFERCKIVDKHLKLLAQKYFDTKFVKVSAPVSLDGRQSSSFPNEHSDTVANLKLTPRFFFFRFLFLFPFSFLSAIFIFAFVTGRSFLCRETSSESSAVHNHL